MDQATGTQAPEAETGAAGDKKFSTFGEWIKQNNNRLVFTLSIMGAYLLGTMVGELNARRAEDRRWRSGVPL